MSDLLLSRVRVSIQQFLRHQDHPWRAETALKRTVGNESFLDRMYLTAIGESLYRQDLRAIDERSKIEAARYRHSIHQYRAASAQSLATAFARAIQAKLALQHLHQILMHRDVRAYLTAIKRETDGSSRVFAHLIRSSFTRQGPVFSLTNRA